MKKDPLSGRPETLPEVPLTTEASDLLSRLRLRIRDRLAEARRVPVAVLIWGPGIQSSSPLAAIRLDLRDTLRNDGHAAAFSEELCETSSGCSIRLQQLVHAQEFDLIVSMPCTPGAIAEIHDFAADHRVNSKTLVFVDSSHMDGYAVKSLSAISTTSSCRVEWYPNDGETSIIPNVTLQEVQRLREMKYLFPGRV